MIITNVLEKRNGLDLYSIRISAWVNKVWLKNNSNLRNSPNDNNETGEKIEESSSKSVITCDCFEDSAVINYTGLIGYINLQNIAVNY